MEDTFIAVEIEKGRVIRIWAKNPELTAVVINHDLPELFEGDNQKRIQQLKANGYAPIPLKP